MESDDRDYSFADVSPRRPTPDKEVKDYNFTQVLLFLQEAHEREVQMARESRDEAAVAATKLQPSGVDNQSVQEIVAAARKQVEHQEENTERAAWCAVLHARDTDSAASGPVELKEPEARHRSAWGSTVVQAPGSKREKALRITTVSETSDEEKPRHPLHSRSTRALLRTIEDKVKRKPLAERLVINPMFDIVVIGLVLLNAVVIGLEIDNESRMNYGISTSTFRASEVIFALLFSLELFIRLLALRSKFFDQPDTLWHVMDVFLVFISWFDIGLYVVLPDDKSDGSNFMTRVIKTSRMTRILRILRVVRFLGHVRSVMLMIWGSMMSLFWLFTVLAMEVFAFSIVLTDGATWWLSSDDQVRLEHPQRPTIEEEFGQIPNTMLTLFECICGGISWGEVGVRANLLGPVYLSIFLWFIFFTTFSILNIVTGVFVESAIQMAENDRALATEKVARAKTHLFRSLRHLMEEMDTDGSGCITLEEWEIAMMDTGIKMQLEVMGIGQGETMELFHLLDNSGDGLVEVSEFLDGMGRFKGHARSLDVHRVIQYTRRILQLLDPSLENMEHLSDVQFYGHQPRKSSKRRK